MIGLAEARMMRRGHVRQVPSRTGKRGNTVHAPGSGRRIDVFGNCRQVTPPADGSINRLDIDVDIHRIRFCRKTRCLKFIARCGDDPGSDRTTVLEQFTFQPILQGAVATQTCGPPSSASSMNPVIDPSHAGDRRTPTKSSPLFSVGNV
jgi:hypothetical protein